jgi:hypothetical protein
VGADRGYSEAMLDISPDDVLALGHLHRDWVRVYSGMGLEYSRFAALENALRLHRQFFVDSIGSVEFATAASELGATLGVSARVELASAIDSDDEVYSDISIDTMAEDYEEAFSMLSNPEANQDYRHQVLVHGALALTTFGGSEHRALADRFLDAGTDIEYEMTKERRRAMTAARYASEFKPLRGIVRVMAVKTVADPYRIPR